MLPRCIIYVNLVVDSSVVATISRSLVLTFGGIYLLVWAFTRKTFHWRGGMPMPVWFARIVLTLFGLFFVATSFFLWKK